MYNHYLIFFQHSKHDFHSSKIGNFPNSLKSFPIYQRLFVCFESQSGRWLPHNLSGWDYRSDCCGECSVWVGVFIQSWSQVTVSLLSYCPIRLWGCNGALGMGAGVVMWQFSLQSFAHAQSDLSVTQPMDCTDRDVYSYLCIFGWMFVGVPAVSAH